MSRKIAIIGAGQAGLLTAHALNQRGYEVTLYSDKDPDGFLEKARPTGVAARFDMSLEWERELGLELWGDRAPNANGVHLHFSPKKDNQLVTLLGRLERPFLSIDLRLQSATWMRMLDEQGGQVEVENVSLERLEEIAGRNDLTIVAAGRRELRDLFPRDEERSSYSEPQRYLAMVMAANLPSELPYAPWFRPVKFNFFAPYGEAFWVPWFSKDGTWCWGMLFEAKTGGPLDRFRGLESAEQVLERGKEVIRDLMPWDYEFVKDGVPADENAWLLGSLTPEVRKVVGTLPSGRNVIAVGDTAQALDPIGGQGANNGNKMARNLVACVIEHGDEPFTAEWMEATFERFWERHKWIEIFNNTLLEPLTPAGQTVLIAQYGSTAKPAQDSPQQRIADRFIENFNDPIQLTPAFHDQERAKAVVEEEFGSTFLPLLKGRARIGAGQLRQKLGRAARHPGT